MRVLTIINGRRTVTEVLEFEPLDDSTILLNAAGDLMDIKITDINITEAEAIATKLLTTGFADLSNYHAEYDEDLDNDEPEHEMEEEGRLSCLVKCRCGTETRFDVEVLKSGRAYCPSCFRKCSAAEVEDEPNPTTHSKEETNLQSAKNPLASLFSRKNKKTDPWEVY